MSKIGEALRALLTEAKMEQQAFADAAGFDRSHFWRITSGADGVGPALAGDLVRAAEKEFGAEAGARLLQAYLNEELDWVASGKKPKGKKKASGRKQEKEEKKAMPPLPYQVVVAPASSGTSTKEILSAIRSLEEDTARKLVQFLEAARVDHSLMIGLGAFIRESLETQKRANGRKR